MAENGKMRSTARFGAKNMTHEGRTIDEPHASLRKQSSLVRSQQRVVLSEKQPNHFNSEDATP